MSPGVGSVALAHGLLGDTAGFELWHARAREAVAVGDPPRRRLERRGGGERDQPFDEHVFSNTLSLALLLHGAGGSPRQALDLLLPVADEQRPLLVAPQSTAASWDMIVSGFGPNVRRVDRVLQEVLEAYPITGMLIGGFSNGTSYALSIGLINGDIFDSVLAFSPGFAAPPVAHGVPRVYVSHGTVDQVLPVDRCSRRLVPRLRALGYEVTYEEFDGGHEVPETVVRRAVDWLTLTS